ncbi:MAG: NigD-like protein [Bacteroidales bacterium]|jgi:hypothetical protein|nr:NigD-like protein [Bacteroidales bacterium]
MDNSLTVFKQPTAVCYVVFFTLCLLFPCCSDDNEQGITEFIIEMAVAHVNADRIYFQLDNGTTLFPETLPDQYRSRLTDRQRVLLQYYPLKTNTSGFDETVRVYSLSNVPVLPIKRLTENDSNMPGIEPMELESIWISGNYINMSCYIYADTVAHTISLVNNLSATYPDDGRLYLEIRHSTNGDFPAFRRKMLLSFDASSLEKGQALACIVHTFDGQKVYYRVYK